MPYRKRLPLISYSKFLTRVAQEKSFTSSTGRRYQVSGMLDEILFIVSLDANTDMDWDIDLKQLY